MLFVKPIWQFIGQIAPYLRGGKVLFVRSLFCAKMEPRGFLPPAVKFFVSPEGR